MRDALDQAEAASHQLGFRFPFTAQSHTLQECLGTWGLHVLSGLVTVSVWFPQKQIPRHGFECLEFI